MAAEAQDLLREPLLPTTNECSNGEAGDAGSGGSGSEAGERHSGHGGTNTWVLTTAILLGDMFGLGALTLPADFARLGWGLTFAVLAVCTLGMMYSGRLFARLAVAYPRVEVFDQLGKEAYGKAGQRLVFATIYLCILITPCIFQIVCTDSLLTMVGGGRLSTLAAHGIVLGIMLPLAQLRNLEEVGWLSTGGTLAMLLAVLIAFLKILALGPDSELPGVPERGAVVAAPSVDIKLVAFMDLCFSYGGAANWMRYISGMRRRAHFTRVATAGAFFMTAAYVVLGAAGYLKLGDRFDMSRPITSVLPYDGWTLVMNSALFLHCIVAYVININVWTDLLLHLIASARGLSPGAQRHQDSAAHRAAWAATSAIGLAWCFLVAYAAPFFDIVTALISSVGDLASAFALPALFSLKLLKLPAWERALCVALVPLAFAVSGVGLYSSVHELISKLRG